MATQYKPTKPQKTKPAKAPKVAKAEKAVKFSSSAQTVKFDKPKKVKEPKAPKAPKPEKAAAFKPGKVEKVSDVKASGKLRKPMNPKVAIVVIAVVVIAVLAVVIGVFFTGGGEEYKTPSGTGTDKLAITALPNKTEFYMGDGPSYAGLQVQVTMENGLTFTVDQTDCQISGLDTSTPGEKNVTVTYDGVTVTYNIVVKELPGDPAGNGTGTSGNFNGLSFKSMPKTEFKVGDWPSVEGGVLLRHYDDGTTKEIEMEVSHIFGFNTSAPGTYTVTVKYVEDGFLATCEYTITVE